MEENVTAKGGLFTSRNIIIGLSVLLAVSVAGLGYFVYQSSPLGKADPKKEIETLMVKVARHMVLPTGETPTLATVSDPTKLKDQKFFQNAKTGDKVLIFSQSQKAILYDPVMDRIIEVAPVNLGQQPAPAPATTDTKP